MRVLMVTDFYPPGIGGIEQHVRTLGAELARRGHQVAVVTLANEGLPPFELDGQVRVYRIRGVMQRLANRVFVDPGRTYALPCPEPVLTAELARIIARERPQLVHGHDWLVRSFLPLKRWSGARLVVSLHYYNLACANKTLLRDGVRCTGPAPAKCAGCAVRHYGYAKGLPIVTANWAAGATERAAVDTYICVSQAVAEGNGLVGGRSPYVVIPNLLPDTSAAVESGDPALAQLPPVPYLLFVGALRRYKGVDVLLRAYETLGEAPPLVLVGSSWPDSPTRFPPNVHVLKNLAHDAVMTAWRRCLFGLAPSVWAEPCPTVVMEAMASGRPVIVSSLGGLPELVADGVNGLVVPPDEPEALARAMGQMITNGALRERLGQAARHMVERYRASVVVPAIEQVYADAIEHRHFRAAPAGAPSGAGARV